MEEKQWYVVNTYSGHENKVKEKLDMRIQSMNMQDYIFRVIVPEKTEIEIKDGVKKEKVKKLFPGYVLVEMIMTDEAWYVVRNTPGVTGFLGSSGKGAKPFPLYKHEIDNILKTIGVSDKPVVVDLKEGDKIKLIDGPFKLMTGKVLEIDKENNMAKLSIDLFGQETTVEAELTQIELDK
jgi:transcriptional antiterminator NusG